MDVDDRHVQAGGRVVFDIAASDAAGVAMGRFASTVTYYESARAPYGEAFFSAVALQLGFDRQPAPARRRDGAGLLAIGFAPDAAKSFGVDPEPGMVDAARSGGARAGARG